MISKLDNIETRIWQLTMRKIKKCIAKRQFKRYENIQDLLIDDVLIGYINGEIRITLIIDFWPQ